MSEIVSKIHGDFNEAIEYVKSFDDVRPIYEYNSNWNFSEYKRSAHSVSTLKEDLEKITNWEKELEKMRARQPCGTLEVVSRNLKQLLIPMPAEKLNAFKGLVRDLARIKC